MIKFFIIILLSLQACSHLELSPEDESKGRYLFNSKLKVAYTQFLNQQVFKNGSPLYAGAAFVAFNNRQSIFLEGLAPSEVISVFYTSKDGSRIEYLDHISRPLEPGKYLIPFNVYFKSLAQLEKAHFRLTLNLKCKKDIKCTYNPASDFFKYKDPYEFDFIFSDGDYFSTENLDLGQFSPSEQTAISHRFIFPGMGQKAAEASIGHESKHFIHGYYNVQFQNGFVQNFEFRFKQDLHFFNRN